MTNHASVIRVYYPPTESVPEGYVCPKCGAVDACWIVQAYYVKKDYGRAYTHIVICNHCDQVHERTP